MVPDLWETVWAYAVTLLLLLCTLYNLLLSRFRKSQSDYLWYTAVVTQMLYNI